jgi:hypothetical protein
MFGTYFKSSLKALPALVLSPILAFVLFAFAVDGYLSEEGYIIADNILWFKEYGGEGLSWMIAAMIIAIIVNFMLLMIIPAAIGGIDSGAKQKQFYLGFFINLAIMLLIPIFAHTYYAFNGLTLGILIGLCVLYFLIPFLVGARLVAPAYVRAFWFSH